MLAFNSLLSLSLIWWIEVVIFFFSFFFFFLVVVLKSGTNGGYRFRGSSGFLCWFWDEEFVWPKGVYVRIGSGSGL